MAITLEHVTRAQAHEPPFDASRPWVVAFEAPTMDAARPILRFASRERAERCWAWMVQLCDNAMAYGAVVELWHHADPAQSPSVEMRELVE